MELKALASVGLLPSCSTSSSSSRGSGAGSRHPKAGGSHHASLCANVPTRSLCPEFASRRAMDAAEGQTTDPDAPATPGPMALQQCLAAPTPPEALSPRRAQRPPQTPGDYLCSTAGSKAHSGARRINRITLIYSLTQKNPLPAPRTGRTRAPAPRGATFSPSRSSPRTKEPPRTPASMGMPQRMSVPPPHGPRCGGRVTSPAEALSASSAQPSVSISSRAAAFPHAGGEGGEPRQSPAHGSPSRSAPPDAAGAGGGPRTALGLGTPLLWWAPRASLASPARLPQHYHPPQNPIAPHVLLPYHLKHPCSTVTSNP